MTRDPSRPPDHPLVELAHDLWDGLSGALAELPASAPGGSQPYKQLREVLRSARGFVDALDVLVDELEREAQSRAAGPPNENGAHHDDFQIIKIGMV
jgi:hypothetical protein